MGLNIAGNLGMAEPSQWGKIGASKPIEKAKSTEEFQEINRQMGTKKAAESSSATAATRVKPASEKPAAEQSLKPEAPQSRPISQEDIKSLLSKINLPINEENQQIISTLLQYHLPASAENAHIIANLLKLRKNKTVEPAVISLEKGLSETPKSIDVLSAFLADNLKLAEQVQKLIQELNQFQSSIKSFKDLFEKGLFQGLNAIIADADDQLKKIVKKAIGEKPNLSEVNVEDLITDYKTLNGFLNGIQQYISEKGQDKNVTALLRQLASLKKELNGFLDTLSIQLILSKDSEVKSSVNDRFFYFQLPNPLAKVSQTIEMLISKSGKNDNWIDPEKAKLILKFETPQLGELHVTIDVNENKVSYLFNSTVQETCEVVNQFKGDLVERMASHNYQVVGVKTQRKKTDLKRELLPSLNLDDLTRVSAEV